MISLNRLSLFMKNYLKHASLFFFTFFLLTACSSSSDNSSDHQNFFVEDDNVSITESVQEDLDAPLADTPSINSDGTLLETDIDSLQQALGVPDGILSPSEGDDFDMTRCEVFLDRQKDQTLYQTCQSLVKEMMKAQAIIEEASQPQSFEECQQYQARALRELCERSSGGDPSRQQIDEEELIEG